MAGFLYVLYIGSLKGKKLKVKVEPEGVKTSQQPESQAVKNVFRAIAKNEIGSALSLISGLSESEQGDLATTKAPSSLLLAVSRCAELNDMIPTMQQLKDLYSKAVFKSEKVFELAAVQAVHGETAEVCSRLLLLGSELELPRTDRAISLLLRAHVYDSATFFSLIKDVTSEVSASGSMTPSLFNDLLALCQKCGDKEAKSLVREACGPATEDDMTRKAKYISRCGRENCLEDAIQAFDEVQDSGSAMTVFMYNCMLDACVKCKAPETAVSYFQEMKQHLQPDVVSYNTVMRAHLDLEDGLAVQNLFNEMKLAGIPPGQITYKALLRATSLQDDRAGVWRIVKEMMQAGITTGFGVRSYLLKGITKRSQVGELKCFLQVLDTDMKLDSSLTVDDTTFTLFMEACVNTGSHELLWERLRMYCLQTSMVKLSAPICGSLIKLYGQSGKPDRAWQVWFLMASHGVAPTSITLGCMVEALVTNKQVEEAWKLVNGLWDDEEKRPLVNTVVYSNIMKGFAMLKDVVQVRAVYREMTDRGIECNRVAFNTILNASAMCGEMEEVPNILKLMREADPPIVPDVITFSTIVKGFCVAGDLEKALALMSEMKATKGSEPDELTYNSMIDGCVKTGRIDTAMMLIDEMKASGIHPSNYTLSIICKVLGRAKQAEKAVAMVQSISQGGGFKPNLQVFTSLILGFIHTRNGARAFDIYNDMMSQGTRPDQKMYCSMALAFLQTGFITEAAEVVRCAYHLAGTKLQNSRGSPIGVEIRIVHDVVCQLGYHSPAGKALVNDLYKFCNIWVSKEDCAAVQAELRKKKAAKSYSK
eukprot:TRINITY_DN26_c0_g1_i2.p1 TRINITY_DN26_c0_g1~~TRINITY_DN26_c0_g1_i2.p1  ORF type:complete len:872 (+),score=200.07 TRINITY_DN26_c0_g1_i2:162-2618(+)